MTDAAARSVIAVDGIDGSGKSVFSRRLAAAATEGAGAAGPAPVILGVDDFRRPIDWRGGGRAQADIYYDDYYDLALLDDCLAAFLAGAPSVEIPVFDSTTERINGRRMIVFDTAPLAIVEGVFALRVPTVATNATLVYLRTSFPEARRRIVARDTARGRSVQDVTHRIDARYFPSQERYLRECDPSGRAQVVIDNERLEAPRILRFGADGIGTTVAAALSRTLVGFAGFATSRSVG